LFAFPRFRCNNKNVTYTKTMSLSEGDRLGRFEILEPIGAGGMGEVWRVRDTELGRDVAIKVLPAEVADSPERRKRFEREARATAGLNHPNLLTIHDVGIDDGRPFIVTELLEGESLRRVLRKGLQSHATTVEWSLAVAHGLAAAHAKAIVHRDIKPDNVFLTTDNRVKILDFGLAKILETEVSDEDETAALSSDTAAGALLGTMGYMAPEQLRGDPVDSRTDVFSFGCVFYELLSGRRPFAGGSSAEHISAVLRDEPPPLDEAVPHSLRAIVQRCLEKKPAARYQSAGEIAAALDAIDKSSLGLAPGKQPSTPIHAAQSSAEPAVAVMPFANLSGDPEQEYFCDGMAEEILGAIGKVRGLKVLARSSSFAFKGQQTDPRKVGNAIGADHLLEGSVQRAGDRIRISARLVQARDGSQLWADRYDRTISDIFQLEDEISAEVANQLRTALLPEELGQMQRRHIPDREANDLYFRGRYLWYRRRQGDLPAAIGLFERAIANDPDFPQPRVGIAEVMAVFGLHCYMDPKIAFGRARAEAEKVLELDESVAAAHSVRGAALGYHEFRFEESEECFKRALELDPGSGIIRCWFAGLMGGFRRFADWENLAREAAAAEPMAPLVQGLAGFNLLQSGSNDGWELMHRALEMDPEHPTVNHYYGLAVTNVGCYEKALPHLEIGFRAGMLVDGGILALAFSELGQTERIKAISAQIDEIAQSRYVPHASRALIALARGDVEECFDHLDAGCSQGEQDSAMVEVYTCLEPYRNHPRYRRLLQKIGIPERAKPSPVRPPDGCR